MAEVLGVSVSKTVLSRGPKAVGSGVLVIQDFEMEMKKSQAGEWLESKPFKVKEHWFAVHVYPNGRIEAQVGYLCIGVVYWSERKVTVCKITISDGEKTVHYEKDELFEENGIEGVFSWNEWETHDTCRTVLKDGALVVKAEVTIMGDTISIDSSYVIQQKCSSFVLENMYRHMMSANDFVLECVDEEIPCHKIVLAYAAEGLLKSNFEENREGRAYLECSAEVGRNLVKFLYTDEIDEKVFEVNIEDFLRLSDMYLIMRLKQRAEQKMLQLLDGNNMAAFYIAGAVFNAGEIRNTAKKLLQANLDWLHKQQNWKEAFGEQKDLLLEVYSG